MKENLFYPLNLRLGKGFTRLALSTVLAVFYGRITPLQSGKNENESCRKGVKKLRLWPYVLAVFIGLFFCWHSRAENSVAGGDILRQALAVTGAQFQDSTVNGWTKLPSADLSDDQLTALVTGAVSRGGFSAAEIVVSRDSSVHHRLARAVGRRQDLHIAAVAQVLYPRQQRTAPEAYMVVNIDAVHDPQAVERQRRLVGEVLRDAGGTPHVSTCLVGRLDGKLEGDEMQRRLREAFRFLGASMDEGMTEGNFASYDGYTRRLPESLTVGNRLVNINMAMRYSSYDNCTYVIIGSPVIAREY